MAVVTVQQLVLQPAWSDYYSYLSSGGSEADYKTVIEMLKEKVDPSIFVSSL